MKTQIRSLLTLVCAATASLLIIGSPAQAGYTVTLEQVGPNVVATGSGAFDLTGLTLFAQGGGFLQSYIHPFTASMATGGGVSGLIDSYSGLSGPTNFGSANFVFISSSNSGDYVALDGLITSSITVPSGYVSGNLLSSSSTWNNETLSSLGVTRGNYVWSWGTGANQNFTLQAGAVPDTGSTLCLLALALAALFGASRLRSIRLA